MTKDFSFFAPIVLVDYFITCKPLLCKTVFDEDWVIETNWLAIHFESDFGVSMLYTPNSIENVTIDNANLLLSWHFRTPWRCRLETMKPKLSFKHMIIYSFVIRYPRVSNNSKFLPIVKNVIVKFILLLLPFSYNKNRPDARVRTKFSSCYGVSLFITLYLLLDIASYMI